MRRTLYILLCLTLLPVALYGQEERKHIRSGNKIYNEGDYEKAQIEYQTAKELNDDSFEASFNLGDAFFKKEKYEEAMNQYKELTERQDLTPEQAGAAWYNLGNSYMATQKLDEAIEAYKNSLRARPNSMEAKYNLEYAKSMKQDQQNQDQQNQDQQNQDQNQQNQDQNQNKDQNQDQQNQDQNKDNQDQNQNKDNQDQNKDQQNQDQNQDQQNQNQDQQNQNQNQQNQDQNQQEQQQSESKISKDDAERLLEALSADEQDVRDKVQKDKMEAVKARQMKIDKDW